MQHNPGRDGIPKAPTASSDFPTHEGVLTLPDTTSEQSLGALGLSADEIAAVSAYTTYEPQTSLTGNETGRISYEEAARKARAGLDKDVHDQLEQISESVRAITGPERFRITPRLLLSEETQQLEQTKRAQFKAAAERTADTRTTADRFMYESNGEDNELADRLVASLTSEDPDVPEIDELVTDVEDLQNVTKLLLYKGLVEHSNAPYAKSEGLLQAVTLLTEATKGVPGFDPREAGVEELRRHAVVNKAFNEYDGDIWDQPEGQESPERTMSNACFEAMVEIDTEQIRRDIKVGSNTKPLPKPMPRPKQTEAVWPAEDTDSTSQPEAEEAQPDTSSASEEASGASESTGEWFENARNAAKSAVHEALKAAVSKQAGVIRKHVPREPGHNGYWELANTYGSSERKQYEEVKETQLRISSQKLPSTYNELDEYVLGLMARGDSPRYLAERLADGAAGTSLSGRKIEDFVDNTAELQTITKLLILKGLNEQGLQPYRYDEYMTLLPALRLLTEATKNVPDFNPAEAGLDALESHTIFQRALLKLESPHWTYNRIRDQSVGDPAYRTTGDCANAIAEIGTTLALRKLMPTERGR